MELKLDFGLIIPPTELLRIVIRSIPNQTGR